MRTKDTHSYTQSHAYLWVEADIKDRQERVWFILTGLAHMVMIHPILGN